MARKARNIRLKDAASSFEEKTGTPQILDKLSPNILPVVPSVRVRRSALADLLERGYSDEEISALVGSKRSSSRVTDELLTVEETDKALRLDRIARQAEHVFGDQAKAYRWLRKAKRGLGGETPLAFLASEAGARAVEEMLYRIEHGIFA